VRLLLDINLSPKWVATLVDSGFEAVHWSAVGNVSAPDAEIARYAESESMIVMTNDLDFGALLSASGDSGPSVVQIRAGDLSPKAIGALVVGALRQMEQELADGALVTIEPDRARLRMLPILRENWRLID